MKAFIIFASVLLSAPVAIRACDLCGCYTPQLETMPAMEPAASSQWWNGFYGAVAEQFTRFGTVQVDGREVSNPTGQYENSSITQLVAGFGINDRFSLQLNVPL